MYQRPLFIVIGVALLSGCYSANEAKLEESIHSWIRIDMPFAQAISILGKHGMECTGGNPASCSRIRGGLQLYSCVERVNVHFVEPFMLVDRIEIPKIGCTGL
jgi:hypothetical protein